MNKTNREKVAEFHRVFGHPVVDEPTVPHDNRMRLRINLILEEVGELLASFAGDTVRSALSSAESSIYDAMSLVRHSQESDFKPDLVKIADALTDILYVVYGAGLELGIDLDATFAEVHGSNMSKLGADGKPIYNPNTGKVLKGENYRPPNLAAVLGIKDQSC